jgi:hypothetical protein
MSFSQSVAVAADKENILYAGVYNPLTIAVENVPGNLIVVKTSRGTVTRDSGGHYTYKGNEPGEIAIVVYKKEKNKLTELGRSLFRVKILPAPTAFVAGLKGGKISKQVLLTIGGVTAHLEDSDFEAYARIDSFSIFILYKGDCNYTFFKNTDNRFNQEIIEAFQKLDADDIVFIKNIYTTWVDGIKRELNPLYFTIAY